jgi:hypothetical protein
MDNNGVSHCLQTGAVTGLVTGHFYIMGLVDSALCRRSVEQRRKPQSMFCVSLKPWLHSDTPIWVRISWTLRILEV